jgi:predicted phage terminase large subunit-like protein
MNALQFVEASGYAAILLRRTYSDLSLPGALMDRAAAWLAGTSAKWCDREKTWYFPSGATLSFGYLDTANDKYRYQSSEFQFIGFDELTQFPKADYCYLFSRLRRLKGSRVPLRMRAASNPGGIGHDWVKQRFLIEGQGAGRVFVPARLDDNPHLDRQGYVASLNELDPVTRAQLLSGDWSVRHGGSIFRREWFGIVENMPPNLRKVRSWDLAATEAKPGTDPDWTVGVLMGRSADGCFYVLDVRRVRTTPQGVENLVRQTAEQDGREVPVLMEQEPGSSGKSLVQRYATVLAGWSFSAKRVTGDKVTRASPFSSQVEAGRVFLVRAPWNEAFLEELEAFPHNGSHDDQVDAAGEAFERLCLAPRTVPGRLLCYPSADDVGCDLDGGREIMRFACPCGHGYHQHGTGGGGCAECGCDRYRGHVVHFTDDEPDSFRRRFGL